VIEVDLVPISARRPMGCEASMHRWVNGKVRSAGVKTNRAGKTLVGLEFVTVKLSNPTFPVTKMRNVPTRSGIWTKEAMQSAEPRGYRFGSQSIPEFVGKASLEVVPISASSCTLGCILKATRPPNPRKLMAGFVWLKRKYSAKAPTSTCRSAAPSSQEQRRQIAKL